MKVTLGLEVDRNTMQSIDRKKLAPIKRREDRGGCDDRVFPVSRVSSDVIVEINSSR